MTNLSCPRIIKRVLRDVEPVFKLFAWTNCKPARMEYNPINQLTGPASLQEFENQG